MSLKKSILYFTKTGEENTEQMIQAAKTRAEELDIRDIVVDFAYLHHSDLDETYRVSAAYRF